MVVKEKLTFEAIPVLFVQHLLVEVAVARVSEHRQAVILAIIRMQSWWRNTLSCAGDAIPVEAVFLQYKNTILIRSTDQPRMLGLLDDCYPKNRELFHVRLMAKLVCEPVIFQQVGIHLSEDVAVGRGVWKSIC